MVFFLRDNSSPYYLQAYVHAYRKHIDPPNKWVTPRGSDVGDEVSLDLRFHVMGHAIMAIVSNGRPTGGSQELDEEARRCGDRVHSLGASKASPFCARTNNSMVTSSPRPRRPPLSWFRNHRCPRFPLLPTISAFVRVRQGRPFQAIDHHHRCCCSIADVVLMHSCFALVPVGTLYPFFFFLLVGDSGAREVLCGGEPPPLRAYLRQEVSLPARCVAARVPPAPSELGIVWIHV